MINIEDKFTVIISNMHELKEFIRIFDNYGFTIHNKKCEDYFLNNDHLISHIEKDSIVIYVNLSHFGDLDWNLIKDIDDVKNGIVINMSKMMRKNKLNKILI